MSHNTFSLLVVRAVSTRCITTGVCTTRFVCSAAAAAAGDDDDDYISDGDDGNSK